MVSAAEKMKDLHPLLCGPPAQKMRDDAWDALIDVVEAAELVVADFDIVYGPIVDALATLSQALEPGEETP